MEIQLKKFLITRRGNPVITIGFFESVANLLGIGGGDGPEVGHEMAKGNLGISRAKNEDEVDSIILKEKDKFTISNRIYEHNGHQVLSYGDQFVPNIVPYTRKSTPKTLYIQMDLLNALESTTFRVRSTSITFKGSRPCKLLDSKKNIEEDTDAVP